MSPSLYIKTIILKAKDILIGPYFTTKKWKKLINLSKLIGILVYTAS